MQASTRFTLRKLGSALKRLCGSEEQGASCRGARRLKLERLEDRTLPSASPLTPPLQLAPSGTVAESIGQPGASDAFQILIPEDGLLTLQTHAADSSLQTRLSLSGPGGDLLAQSDGQSDANHDALLAQHLQAGTYAIQVQGLADGTGNYTLASTFSSAIAPFQSLPTGTVSAKVAVGDLNGDHIPDLVVGDYFNSDLVVLIGRGDGTFQDAGSLTVDGPPTSVVIGDFNGDGIPDLATANQTDRSISVLLGKGDGSFQAPIRTPIQTLPFDLVATDLNRDGHLDLVATSTTTNDVTVLLSDGTGHFQVKGSFTVGFGNSGVVAADFNGDGIPDLAASNFLSGTVSVLRGLGDGTFAPATTIDLGPNTLPGGVVAADFNRDGRPDLATANFTTNDVSILMNNGDGTFQAPVRYAVGLNPNDLVAADFNGDGIVDLATADFGTNDVSVLLGQPDGTFRNVGQRFGVGTTPYSLVAADLNGDNIPDLTTVNLVSRDVSVLTGLGDGTFLAQGQLTVATAPSVAATGDFNGDGIPDVVAADFGSSDVGVLLGRGDGTFQNQVRFPTGVNPVSAIVGDFNGDGILDIATADVSSYTVSVLLGNGDGTFQKARSFPVGISPFAVAAGDFNGDGHLDLIAANRASGDVSVLLGDGTGNFTLLPPKPQDSAFPGETGFPVHGAAPMALAVGDFNGDGHLDVATADFGSGMVSILLGNGDGTFTFGGAVPVGKGPIFVIADDFNGDRKLDLAVTNNLSNSVSVLLGNGDGTFQPQLVLTTGEQPRSLVAGDFNHDGKRDLAVANLGARNAPQAGGVSVFLGNGDGTFSAAAQSPFAAGPGLWGLAAGDFNGNGKLDLAVTNITANSVTVLQGHGDGTFQEQGRFAVGTGPVPLAVADFNRDGRPDLARANYDMGTVTVLLGAGDGTLPQAATVQVGQGPIAVVAADVNGDGRADLISANFLSGDVSVLLGRGDGTFLPESRVAVGATPSALAVGDFNRDGRLDLAVTNAQTNEVTILLGNGDGTFRQAGRFAVGQEPDALVTGDFNGDGILDLAVGNYGSKDVSILLGRGDGTFAPQTRIGVGAGPVALIAADLDADGRLDLAVANYTSQQVALLWGRGNGMFDLGTPLNVGTGPTWLVAGDFNGDGSADLATANNVSGDVSLLVGLGNRQFAPALRIPVGDFPFAVAVADFNGDGRPDLAVATQLSTAVSVLLGVGNGGFFPTGTVSAPVQSTPLVADLNGDGLGDVTVLSNDGRILYRQRRSGPSGDFAAPVVLNPDPRFAARALALVQTASGPVLAALDATDSALSFYVLLPDGSFQRTSGPVVPGFLPTALAAGDLTGDGLSDLVVTAAGSGQVFVYLQSTAPGAGTSAPLFGPPTYEAQVGAGPASLTLADMDGDGRLDIVVTDQLSGDVSVLLNTPGQPFASVTRFRAGPGPYGTENLLGTTVVQSQLGTAGVVAGRFDANSPLDLVVTNSRLNSFSLLKGDGFGGLLNPVTRTAFTTGLQPTEVVAGLLTGGPFLDLAVLDEGSSEIAIFAGDGKGDFTRVFTIDAGNQPTGLTLADINGDGRLDLVVGNTFGDVLVLLGKGDGTFRPYQRVDRSIALAVADLNGDGKPDFIFGNQSLDRVSVQYSQPGQSFVQGRGDGLLAPSAVTTADLNGDGIPDLVVVNSGANDVLVYLGLGNGQFGPAHTEFVGTNPVAVTVHDVNGDGIPDLLVANEGSNDVSVLLGAGQGANWTLTPGLRLQAGGLGPVSTTVADVNGDGLPDLLVVNSQSDTVAVLPGVGQGFFDDRHPVLLQTGSEPQEVLVGNFDGRSALEMVTVNAGSNDLSFFAGLGVGIRVPTGGEGPVAAVAADFNGDGLTDLIVANNTGGQLTVLMGTPNGPMLFGLLAANTLNHPTALVLSADLSILYVAVEGQDVVVLIVLDFGAGFPTSSSILVSGEGGSEFAPSGGNGDEESRANLVFGLIPFPSLGGGAATIYVLDAESFRDSLLATVGFEVRITVSVSGAYGDAGGGEENAEVGTGLALEETQAALAELMPGIEEGLRGHAERTRESLLQGTRDPAVDPETEGEAENGPLPLWPSFPGPIGAVTPEPAERGFDGVPTDRIGFASIDASLAALPSWQVAASPGEVQADEPAPGAIPDALVAELFTASSLAIPVLNATIELPPPCGSGERVALSPPADDLPDRVPSHGGGLEAPEERLYFVVVVVAVGAAWRSRREDRESEDAAEHARRIPALNAQRCQVGAARIRRPALVQKQGNG